MDSTPDTNKQNLILVVVSAISSEGRNIIIGIGFMAEETAENYIWLLKSILGF